jgi:hypothetical protein
MTTTSKQVITVHIIIILEFSNKNSFKPTEAINLPNRVHVNISTTMANIMKEVELASAMKF